MQVLVIAQASDDFRLNAVDIDPATARPLWLRVLEEEIIE
jgi:hypothetical protein